MRAAEGWWGGVVVETFWMFDEGVAALTAQVDRARVDAEKAKAHVERYCKLTLVGEGVLLDTFGAHERAVGLVLSTLGDLVERTKYVVDGIGASVEDYRTIDDESSRVFGDLASVLGRGSDPPSFLRHGLTFAGRQFSDVAEPTDVLRDPNIGQRQPLWDFDPYSVDWFNPSAWVRDVINEMAGRDPFEEAVRWLSGDWTAFERVLFTWVEIEQFSERLGKNLARAALELPEVWKGREAGAAQWYLHALANATTDFGQFCGTLVGHYRNAVEAAKSFNELASGILSDLVINAALGAAATVVLRGAPHPLVRVAAGAALAVIGSRVGKLVKRLLDGVDKFQKVAELFNTSVNTYQFTRMKALVVQESLR